METRSKPLLVHLVPSERLPDEHYGRLVGDITPGWLVGALPSKKRLNRLPVEDTGDWWAPFATAPAVMVEIELLLTPRTVVYCNDCVRGRPCDFWGDGAELHELGFRAVEEPEPAMSNEEKAQWDRAQAWVEAQARNWYATFRTKHVGGDLATAAAVLGLSWPCTHEDVTRAFRVAAAREHPDHGGSDESIKRVIAARETLERAIGAAK